MIEPDHPRLERTSAFLSMPSTRVGRASTSLLAISLLLILFNNLVVMPQTEQRSGLEWLQQALNLTVFLFVFLAGAAALLAIVKKRERSWTLFVSALLLLLALALNLGSLIAR